MFFKRNFIWLNKINDFQSCVEDKDKYNTNKFLIIFIKFLSLCNILHDTFLTVVYVCTFWSNCMSCYKKCIFQNHLQNNTDRLSENNFRNSDTHYFTIHIPYYSYSVSIFLVNITTKIFPLRLIDYLFNEDTFAYDENISVSKTKRHFISNGLIQ